MKKKDNHRVHIRTDKMHVFVCLFFLIWDLSVCDFVCDAVLVYNHLKSEHIRLVGAQFTIEFHRHRFQIV